ncbi:uncharacterized protein [Malus domestica]|uniref:uncharacterized protein n=1 Tax=Malus domestica TaxID=3750 RepID=UPI003975E509
MELKFVIWNLGGHWFWRKLFNLEVAVGVVSEDCSVLKVEGNGVGNQTPPTTRSVSEIIASIQRSKIGIEDWSLSDLTIGLFLIYLRQASVNPFEDVNGVQVSSDSMVQDLIYHSELAKGSYKDNTAALARNTMLRESNVLKFVKDSSVMRPGYYIGIDPCKKLVILGIRGTHTVYDLITDVVSSSDGEVTFEGYSTHFGTTEAARWFLSHEMGNIRKCLEKCEVGNLFTLTFLCYCFFLSGVILFEDFVFFFFLPTRFFVIVGCS